MKMLLDSNSSITQILYRNLSNPPKLWTLRHFGSHASTTNNPCEELGTTGSTQFFAGFVRTAPWWPALTSLNSDQPQHGLYPVLYGPQFRPMRADHSWIWFVSPHGFLENIKKEGMAHYLSIIYFYIRWILDMNNVRSFSNLDWSDYVRHKLNGCLNIRRQG